MHAAVRSVKLEFPATAHKESINRITKGIFIITKDSDIGWGRTSQTKQAGIGHKRWH